MDAGKRGDGAGQSAEIPGWVMWLSFCAAVLFVIYGSLYPFGFDAGSFDSHSIPEFLESWRHFGGRGDILGNILLSLPLGVFGMLAAPHGRAALPHLILVAFVAL